MKAEMQTFKSEQQDMKAEMQAFKSEQQDMKAEMQTFKSEQQDMKAEMQAFKSEQKDMKAEMQAFKSEQQSFRAEVMERFDQTATITSVAELISEALLPQLEEMQKQQEELQNTMNARFDELAGTVEYLEVASVKQATDILKLKRLK